MPRNTSFILSVRSFDSFDVMTRLLEALRRPSRLPVIVAAIAVAAAACGGDVTVESAPESNTDDPAPVATAANTKATAEASDAVGGAPEVVPYDFPTGEAVLVAAGYTHPNDRVDNTGAYLPTNGKPTLVFVDAIW